MKSLPRMLRLLIALVVVLLVGGTGLVFAQASSANVQVLSLTPGVVVMCAGFGLALTVHIIVIARWTMRIQTMQENHEREIITLRQLKHEHSEKIAVLQANVEHLEVETARIEQSARRELREEHER